MVSIFFTFEAGRLLHIYLFLDWTIQEGTLGIHLIKLKMMVSSIGVTPHVTGSLITFI
jgi:hypothetical protein